MYSRQFPCKMLPTHPHIIISTDYHSCIVCQKFTQWNYDSEGLCEGALKFNPLKITCYTVLWVTV